jgi:hypothetical protein
VTPEHSRTTFAPQSTVIARRGGRLTDWLVPALLGSQRLMCAPHTRR